MLLSRQFCARARALHDARRRLIRAHFAHQVHWLVVKGANLYIASSPPTCRDASAYHAQRQGRTGHDQPLSTRLSSASSSTMLAAGAVLVALFLAGFFAGADRCGATVASGGSGRGGAAARGTSSSSSSGGDGGVWAFAGEAAVPFFFAAASATRRCRRSSCRALNLSLASETTSSPSASSSEDTSSAAGDVTIAAAAAAARGSDAAAAGLCARAEVRLHSGHKPGTDFVRARHASQKSCMHGICFVQQKSGGLAAPHKTNKRTPLGMARPSAHPKHLRVATMATSSDSCGGDSGAAGGAKRFGTPSRPPLPGRPLRSTECWKGQPWSCSSHCDRMQCVVAAHRLNFSRSAPVA